MITMKQLLFISLALLFTACGSSVPETPATKATEMAQRIQIMEDSLFNSMEFDARKAQGLVDVYKAYASAFPADTLTPEYLFRAAGVHKSMRQPQQSIAMYDRIIRDYTQWRRIADAFYLKAFTMDSEMNQKGEAERAYKEVINMFPDHPFARDARIMIDNLQLTDDELIMKFKNMQEEQTQQAQQ